MMICTSIPCRILDYVFVFVRKMTRECFFPDVREVPSAAFMQRDGTLQFVVSEESRVSCEKADPHQIWCFRYEIPESIAKLLVNLVRREKRGSQPSYCWGGNENQPRRAKVATKTNDVESIPP